MLSGEEAEAEGDGDGSYSSRMSNKSEKNMADFDGADSVCEEELAQLAEHVRKLFYINKYLKILSKTCSRLTFFPQY